ncbi:MAG: FAD binding domain-containing protein [Thermoplasmata archaeon]|nr:FAD binding domain-containing protein [Thermoplasmata archaeon]
MSFTLATPATVAEALRLLADRPEETAVLAGGTDLLIDLEDGTHRPRQLLSLRRLPWRALRWNGPSLTIGALAPLAEIEADPRVQRRLPSLARAIHAVGSVALRHRATLGGNLGRASPTSDLIPLLLVLDATLTLVRTGGRRELPVDAFVRGSRRTALAPGELIESVTLPSPLPSEYLWQRVRLANDISQVGVAVARGSSAPEWRIALSGVTPRAVRLPTAEKLLGQGLPAPLALELAAQEAARRAPFATDKRASEAYRRRLVQVLVKRAVTSLTSSLPAAPGTEIHRARRVAAARRRPPGKESR